MNFDTSSFTERAQEIVSWLEKEFSAIRTGQASPALLDSIRVESYGAQMPLNQVATIGVEDARTLRIAPWDASQISAVEKAVSEADLGLSVATDESGIRAVFPELTGERRQQLAKLAKQKHEEARVSLRAARDEIMKAVDTSEKEGEMSEDEKFTVKEAIQKNVDQTNDSLDGLFKVKEDEITTV